MQGMDCRVKPGNDDRKLTRRFGVMTATASGVIQPEKPSQAFALDGLSIARQRISREAEEKTGFLDLGNLALSELPEDLFALKHLRQLNLGWGYLNERGE